MKTNRASWTAEITTIFRAVETNRPPGRRVCCDPYAHRFLPPGLWLILKSRLLTAAAIWLAVERRFPGGVATIAVRIRHIDDCLARCLTDGIEQIVILGAGYDSRAYRLPHSAAGVRVLEVDHPLTQQRKKERLRHIFGALPPHVGYVAIDFEAERLADRLPGSGYDPRRRTLFICEGVSKYLTAAAVDSVLRFVSGHSPAGSRIVFDYLFKEMVSGGWSSPLTDRALAYQRRKGEPYLFGLPAEGVEDYLRSRGFSSVVQTTPRQLAQAYFARDRRARKIHPFWGIAQAIV